MQARVLLLRLRGLDLPELRLVRGEIAPDGTCDKHDDQHEDDLRESSARTDDLAEVAVHGLDGRGDAALVDEVGAEEHEGVRRTGYMV